MKIEDPRLSVILSVLSVILALYSFIDGKKWIALILGVTSVAAIFIALKLYSEKKRNKKSNIVIENTRIESLNLANLARLKNSTLKVDTAIHRNYINGNDLAIEFEYSGICTCDDGESGITFSVDCDSNLGFEQMNWYGYDLIVDTNKTHKIHPKLLGAEGLTKKVMLPFAKKIIKYGKFHTSFRVTLPGCMKTGKDYVTATFSFNKLPIDTVIIELWFMDLYPKYVHLYDVTNGVSTLEKELIPTNQISNKICYVDNINNLNPETALVYYFER